MNGTMLRPGGRCVRLVLLASLSIGLTACEVRDFGCLTGGYSVMAPSHAEIGVADADSTFVLERYVTQIGQAKGFIVARCDMPDQQRAVVPLDLGKPCSGYNVIDTRTGRVWRGLDDIAAESMLGRADVSMPAMDYVSDYFNQAWPEGRPGNFCLAHPQENASARQGFAVHLLLAFVLSVLPAFLVVRIALKRRSRD